MQLRSKIAGSCELHMAALAELVSWGAAVESKLVRAALVRLCVKAGSLGGGMSPFLIPLVSGGRSMGRQTAFGLLFVCVWVGREG